MNNMVMMSFTMQNTNIWLNGMLCLITGDAIVVLVQFHLQILD
jgi:hypothetical protein